MMNPVKSINIDFAQRVAMAYEDMSHNPKGEAVKKAYFQLAVETIRQYQVVLADGIKVDFDGGKSLYNSPQGAISDIEQNNHLFVTPTRGAFGMDAAREESFRLMENPLLNNSGFYISGQPALINDLFRAIHDYFGHYKGGNGFRALGEENAYRYHCTMFSPLAQKALTTETRGQNCWLNYGPHGDHNRKAKQSDTVFADQKTGLLPAFCMENY